MSESTGNNGWIKVYHASGLQVTLPLPASSWKGMYDAVTEALSAGWLVNAPGLDEGEQKEMIGWVVKQMKDAKRPGEPPTTVIDLYPDKDQFKWAYLRVYLNRPEDVQDFERASGLKVANIPEYVGSGRLERGASQKTDAFITRAPRPFGVIWRHNPDYNPDEQDTTKKKPARKFVRWDSIAPPTAAPRVSPQQVEQLTKMMGVGKVSAADFQMVYHCQVAELPAEKFEEAFKRLKSKADAAIEAAASMAAAKGSGR